MPDDREEKHSKLHTAGTDRPTVRTSVSHSPPAAPFTPGHCTGPPTARGVNPHSPLPPFLFGSQQKVIPSVIAAKQEPQTMAKQPLTITLQGLIDTLGSQTQFISFL